ncbi:hypothetical protein [Nocardia lijiangensis]|uniref:hypothetical protein n=1 Tax=Nocardia lijiangensis TaxID=299618 RepID=UPI003D760016
MVVYGAGETPRVLVQGIAFDAPILDEIKKYAGHVETYDSDAGVRWESWDVVISRGEPVLASPYPKVRVIQVGGTPVGLQRFHVPSSSGLGGSTMNSFRFESAFEHSKVRGSELVIPDNLDTDWRELAKTILLPILKLEPLPRTGFGSWEDTNQPRGYVIPLITDLDGVALAMRYRPPIGPLDCLYLPRAINDLTPWALAAFREWAKSAPETFPSEPEWTSDPRWMTTGELNAQEEVGSLRSAMQQAMAEMQANLEEAERRLGVAQAAAHGAERLLLTGTGTSLVTAVYDALVRLGFMVLDMDATGAREKREDLRVSDGGWQAICEVKGYGKGASTTDLLKIGRFESLFTRETGDLPDAKWYIANQFRDRNPSTRQPLLKGQDDSVEEFAAENGLVLDTRELFQLDKAVASGRLEKDEARRLLREARGRFLFDPPSNLREP